MAINSNDANEHDHGGGSGRQPPDPVPSPPTWRPCEPKRLLVLSQYRSRWSRRYEEEPSDWTPASCSSSTYEWGERWPGGLVPWAILKNAWRVEEQPGGPRCVLCRDPLLLFGFGHLVSLGSIHRLCLRCRVEYADRCGIQGVREWMKKTCQGVYAPDGSTLFLGLGSGGSDPASPPRRSTSTGPAGSSSSSSANGRLVRICSFDPEAERSAIEHFYSSDEARQEWFRFSGGQWRLKTPKRKVGTFLVASLDGTRAGTRTIEADAAGIPNRRPFLDFRAWWWSEPLPSAASPLLFGPGGSNVEGRDSP